MRLKVIEGEFAYFANEGQLLEKVVEMGIERMGMLTYFSKTKLVLHWNLHIVLCPCFSVDL